LRLLAQNNEDLQIISSMVQDAVSRVGDISRDGKSKQLIIAMNRFCWERGKRSAPARTRSALQVSGVLNVKSSGITIGKPNGILSLLAIKFTPDKELKPGGHVEITFSGGGALMLYVECLDAALVDLSEPWGAKSRPKHG